jgi:hypothetical protein
VIFTFFSNQTLRDASLAVVNKMIISRLAPVLMTGLGSLVSLCHATGSLNGLPILNGPIPVVPQNDPDMKRGPGEFIHPGLWHTHDDLERIKKGVENQEEPYASAFEKFSANEFSQANVSIYLASHNPNGPVC